MNARLMAMKNKKVKWCIIVCLYGDQKKTKIRNRKKAKQKRSKRNLSNLEL